MVAIISQNWKGLNSPLRFHEPSCAAQGGAVTIIAGIPGLKSRGKLNTEDPSSGSMQLLVKLPDQIITDQVQLDYLLYQHRQHFGFVGVANDKTTVLIYLLVGPINLCPAAVLNLWLWRGLCLYLLARLAIPGSVWGLILLFIW